jgi:hypothetical protein
MARPKSNRLGAVPPTTAVAQVADRRAKRVRNAVACTRPRHSIRAVLQIGGQIIGQKVDRDAFTIAAG